MRWQQQCWWWLTHDRMVEAAGVVTVWSISSWLVTSNISPASYLVITGVRWSADHSSTGTMASKIQSIIQNQPRYLKQVLQCVLSYVIFFSMLCDVMCCVPPLLCNWCKIITQWRCRVRGPGLETPGYSEQCVLCIMSTRAINGGSRIFPNHREGPY